MTGRVRLLRRLVPVVSALLAMAAGEAALRLFFHAAPQLEVDIYRRDGEGRLLLRPNLVRRHVGPRWDVTIRTNSRSRRDQEDPPRAGQRVVLGLGDSFAFGWGVELPETFYSRAERASEMRLVKAGVPGTGPPDYVRMLEWLGPRIRPAAAVVAIFVGNDFSDAAHGGAEQFVVDGGLLVRRSGEPVSVSRRVRDWAARRSHLLQLLRAVQFNLSRQPGLSLGGAGGARGRVWDSWMREFAGAHLAAPDPLVLQGFERTADALDRIAEQCEELDAALLILALPRSWQIDSRERQEMLDGLRLSEEALDLDRPQDFLRSWAERRAAAFCDPLPAMRAHARDPAAPPLYFTPDAHLAPAGHQVIGDVLAQSLAALLSK